VSNGRGGIRRKQRTVPIDDDTGTAAAGSTPAASSGRKTIVAQWKLASTSPPLTLNVSAGDEGALSGTFTTALGSYPVAGSWAASGSLPGRNASAFSFSGAAGGSATTFIAAVGIMIGPGPSPTRIDLHVSESASTDGSLTESTATLLPTG
jgi:hypothetical protein